jgi:anti-sigma regulatory factor (Ser/Thr protein kinase)
MHRGRGLQLMEGLTDEVEVVRSDEGTTIELSRQLGVDAA